MQEKDRFLKKQINLFIFSILFFIILYCKNTTGDEISSKVGDYIKDLNFFSSKFVQSNGSLLEEGYIYIKDDLINVAYTQGFLKDKYKSLKSMLNYNMLLVPSYFKDKFMKQLTLRDFIIMENDEISSEIKRKKRP